MHKTLEIFQNNNPKVIIKDAKDAFIILKPWNDKSFIHIIPKEMRIPNIKSIILFDDLVAFYDKKIQKFEFIFMPIKKDTPLLIRNFIFNYSGFSFKCYFENSSRILRFFATTFIPSEAEGISEYRNLREFKDYYSKSKPDYLRDYYKDKAPYSFYVEGPLENIINEKIKFLKSLNFYLSYFDRKSPQIQIMPTDIETEEVQVPCYSLSDEFPTSINASNLDTILLDIIEVAKKTTDIRLELIFYYQVIEYAAYYFLEENVNKKLNNIIKRPDINTNANDYIREIIEIFTNHFNVHKKSDREKIIKIIRNYCTIDDIKLELFGNKELFKQDLEFDGGFNIKKLFENEDVIKTIGDGILDNIMDNLIKIRNVVVHLREHRENAVILPTDKNNTLIQPYLYVLRRLAEKVAIQYE